MELGGFSVSLAVKDLQASRAFYEKFGFQYERESVFHEAAIALGVDDVHAFLRTAGRALGRPSQARHERAAAAARAAQAGAWRRPALI